MRHRKKGRQLSRTRSHRKATLRNLATSLFRHERIETTTAKAKELRPFAERLITLARRGDVHARRLAATKIQDREVLGSRLRALHLLSLRAWQQLEEINAHGLRVWGTYLRAAP